MRFPKSVMQNRSIYMMKFWKMMRGNCWCVWLNWLNQSEVMIWTTIPDVLKAIKVMYHNRLAMNWKTWNQVNDAFYQHEQDFVERWFHDGATIQSQENAKNLNSEGVTVTAITSPHVNNAWTCAGAFNIRSETKIFSHLYIYLLSYLFNAVEESTKILMILRFLMFRNLFSNVSWFIFSISFTNKAFKLK